MSIPAILVQVAITLVVVALYHLWVSRKRQAAPLPPAVVTPLPPVIVAPIAPPPKTPPAMEPVPPEILAVIAAAIAVVLGRSHRVVSVQQAVALAPEGNVWAIEGRVEQFLSHRVR